MQLGVALSFDQPLLSEQSIDACERTLVLSSVQGGLSQQTHPARAVMEILKSGAKMSMLAVDIGAAGGNPEIGPLFRGDEVTGGRRWGGIQVDPRAQWLDKFPKVKNVESTAEPPTIAGILWDNCMPHDIDILKLDILTECLVQRF